MSESTTRKQPDGTERLCLALYGAVKPRHYLGGSQARMLHDAADAIVTLRAVVDALPACMTEGCDKKATCAYFDIMSCDEHSDSDYSDLPYASALRDFEKKTIR
jgi:hypothetical protein